MYRNNRKGRPEENRERDHDRNRGQERDRERNHEKEQERNHKKDREEGCRKSCRKGYRRRRSCVIPGWLYNNPGIEQKIRKVTRCWKEVEEQLNNPHARIGKKHKNNK